MKNIWQSMGPLGKAIVSCVAIELGIILLLTMFTLSILSSIVTSAVFFGPVSIWIGPVILKRYRLAEVTAH